MPALQRTRQELGDGYCDVPVGELAEGDLLCLNPAALVIGQPLPAPFAAFIKLGGRALPEFASYRNSLPARR